MIESFYVIKELIKRGYSPNDINNHIVDILEKEKDAHLIAAYLSCKDSLYINDIRRLILAFVNAKDQTFQQIATVKSSIIHLVREEELFLLNAEFKKLLVLEKMIVDEYYTKKIKDIIGKSAEEICTFTFDSSYSNDPKLPFEYIDILADAIISTGDIKWILYFAYLVPLAPRDTLFSISKNLGYKGSFYEVESMNVVDDDIMLPLLERVNIVFGKKIKVSSNEKEMLISK